MLRRNGPVVKSVESVLRPEGSLWGERFVEEVLVVWTIIWCHLLNELLYILALCQYTPSDNTQG